MTSIAPSPISGLFFDWGARPPKNVVVYIGNQTDGEGGLYGEEIIITVDGVVPNLPYEATAAGQSDQAVLPVVGNSTTVDVVGGAWSGEYAKLVIEGCWEGDGAGATVGEFVLISG